MYQVTAPHPRTKILIQHNKQASQYAPLATCGVMSLCTMSVDALSTVCAYLDTCDLLQLDSVRRLASFIWDREVIRRCGAAWPSGKAGLWRLRSAVTLCFGPRRYYASVHWLVATGPTSAHSVSAAGVWAWHGIGGKELLAPLGNLAAISLCSLSEDCVAVGHAFGVSTWIRVGQTFVQGPHLVTGTSVTGIAAVAESTFWLTTSQQRAYAWCTSNNRLSALCVNAAVHCVSGPRGVLGTDNGLWPARALLESACRCVRQSAVLVAGLHDNGFISTFDARTLHALQVFDANPCAHVLSVVGDMVCIDGAIWSRGRLRGYCPYDVRQATDDGHVLMLTQARSATLCVSFFS